MSNDNAGRSPRTSGGTGPMGSTVAIVVTAIALVLGFLILRNINDDDDNGGGGGDDGQTEETTTTADGGTTTTLTPGTTTTEALVTEGTMVQVANASTQNGVAGQMSTALEAEGFDMAEPTNATVKLTDSKVIYNADDPAALPVAESLARLLGDIPVEPSGLPVPAGDGNWATGSAVILMLGDDLAGKTIDQIQGQTTTGTTSPPTT
jgi:hypothetical protein